MAEGFIEVTWKEEQDAKRCVENLRVGAATVATIAAAGCVLFLYMSARAANEEPVYYFGLIAALVATAIVAGARALEGPEPSPESRRRGGLSPASQLVRSWLSCFLAVAAVLLLTQLFAKVEPVLNETQNPETVVSVTGNLQIKTTDETHQVEIVSGKLE